ncbi:hypothetical protein K432DRAFT_433016 [Lepidopterella palustris CBS 459.81]|uniref:Mus7/MMS22 family-domain-containing protein n=1 Tax=Lepidopterella palustris CBS 459.81 TaxID=1314670 RepID=A0A8E2EFT9_9PEZI|nr:hypothetical protein K432DRAFT_433016 [Lepidopterella palustris CBS 459.81]
MSRWRDIGFVQDSDEEDDFDSNISSSPPEQLAIQPGSEDGKPTSEGAQDAVVFLEDEGAELRLSRVSTAAKEVASTDHLPIHSMNNICDGPCLHSGDDIDELQQDLPTNPLRNNTGTGIERNQTHPTPPEVSAALHFSTISSSPLSSPARSNSDDDVDGLGSVQRSEIISAQPRLDDNVQVVITKATQRGQSRSPPHIEQGLIEKSNGRVFRTRMPIQLHPYLLENEMYRQTLRARGIKPVFVAPDTSVHQSETQDAEILDTETQEQDVDSQESQSLSSNTPRVSQRKQMVSTPKAPRMQANASPFNWVLDDSDELPDVRTLIGIKGADGVQQGPKRRKTMHTFSEKHRLSKMAERVNSDHLSPRLPLDSNDSTVPPSPPNSRSPDLPISRNATKSGFRMPKDMSLISLPTPITSSEAKAPPQRTSLPQSDSDTPPRSTLTQRRRLVRNASITIISSSSKSSSGSESESVESSQLRRVEKKMKGVLPASWLKLDIRAQTDRQAAAKAQTHQHPSAERMEHHRGVAQKIIKSSRRTRSRSPIRSRSVEIASDSDESASVFGGELVEELPSFLEVPRETIDLTSNAMDLDNMEDDRIDYMLPAISRKRRTGHGNRKRQLKLTDSFERPNKRTKRTNPHAHHPAAVQSHTRTNGTDAARRSHNSNSSRPKPPRLSILDSHQTMLDATNTVPQFIRIAARQARRRPDKGRQSPKSKCIRLQTTADTNDATRTLQDWRAGTLVPSTDFRESGVTQSKRLPLSDRTNNHQQMLPPPLKKRFLALDGGLSGSPKRWVKNAAIPISKLRQTQLNPSLAQGTHDRLMARSAETLNNSPLMPWHIQRQSSAKQPSYRTAQLEGLETDFDQRHQESAFQKVLSCANRQFEVLSSNGLSRSNPQLARFLADNDAVSHVPPHEHSATPTLSCVRISRKRPARRINIQAREFRQPSEPPPEDYLNRVVDLTVDNRNSSLLLGLGHFGTRYTTDFDVFPLEVGTFFHHETFVGSGELMKCLHAHQRDRDVLTASCIIVCNETSFQCSSWTEEVSSKLMAGWHGLFGPLDNLPQSNLSSELVRMAKHNFSAISAFLRSMIQYFSASLSFLDPIDRRSCVATTLELLRQVFNAMESTANVSWLDKSTATEIDHQFTRIFTYTLALAGQVFQISGHPSVESAMRDESGNLVKQISRASIVFLLRKGMSQLRSGFDENRVHILREAGIRSDKAYVESLVVSMHVLDQLDIPGSGFWDVVNEELSLSVHNINQLAAFEQIWYRAFTLLPYVELDSSGVLRVGRRYSAQKENWGFIKAMINRLFALYPETSKRQSSTLNEYIRSVLARCHNLVKNWGWKRCETMLIAVFDFFTQNGLKQLRHEEIRGSPAFLELLAQHPALEIHPEDQSFHIFLKTLALGLKGMRNLYPENKLRGITFRLIPNHGRTYRRDEDIKRNDLNALRNHHDLLCTLYWSSLPTCRPRFSQLQGLVDHTLSHREACRLSVRAWANLVRFQLSTNEPYDSLQPFALWYKEIVKQTIKQYRLAKTELESQYQDAQDRGDNDISKEELQSIIRKNQNQVLATLRDAVAGMKNAISGVRDEQTAICLLKDSMVADVLNLFDAKNARLNAVVSEALDIFSTFAGLHKQLRTQESQQVSEESQDYGEWPELDDIEGITEEQINNIQSVDFIHTPLWHLLSNAFGAESSPDDVILTQSVDTWVAFAQWLVHSGRRSWGDFIGSFSPVSWHQLRDTEQTRKFTSYFMSSIVECGRNVYQEYREEMMSAWLLSLVERESMLKFQHRLTSAILHVDFEHPLLQNLPFLKDSQTGRISLTAHMLRERRLGLLSSILANMRDSFEMTMRERPQDLVNTKLEYASLLKKLMSAMKNNYLELQQGSAAKGAYVIFVQKVVEFLQQYTAEICKVDDFFTDSAAFPLPATDPTYVVGRLKSYALKLSDPRTTKQLSSYIQNVSERAAVDSQQPYLVSQLHTAMSGKFESGDAGRPTLRNVLLQAIFPAYIETTFRSAVGWIIAKPILLASCLAFQDLFYNFSVTDDASVKSCVAIFRTFSTVLCRVTESLVDHAGLLGQPHVLHVLAHVFWTVTAMLPLLDYIQSRTHQASDVLPFVKYFKKFSIFVAENIFDIDISLAPYFDGKAMSVAAPFTSLREFSTVELEQALKTNWSKVGEQYFVGRGNMRKEVAVEVGTIDEEQQIVISAIEGLHAVMERMGNLGLRASREKQRVRGGSLGALVI